jgi:Uma2 family endonuclease
MATHEIRSHAELELGPGDAGRAVSAEEFASACYQEPWRYERERGRLVVVSPDGGDHVEAADPLLERLMMYRVANRETVERVVPNSWVRVNERTDRIGDIGVFLIGEATLKKIPHRVPDLMFEIVSPGRTSRHRDYVKKRREYERLGVKEYVIIDRFKKQVTVHALAPGGYLSRVLTIADTYSIRLLPGLVIPLSEVWGTVR